MPRTRPRSPGPGTRPHSAPAAEAGPRVPGAPWSTHPPRRGSLYVCGPDTPLSPGPTGTGPKRKREKPVLDRGLSAQKRRLSSLRDFPGCSKETHQYITGSIPGQFPGVVTPKGAPTWKLSARAGSQRGSRQHTAHQAHPGLPPGDQPRPCQARRHTASHQSCGRGHTHPEAWIPARGSKAGALPQTLAYPPWQPEPPGTRPAPWVPIFTQGTCQTPGDDPAALSARSWGAWGPRGPTACRSSRTVTPGPLWLAFHTACLLPCYFPVPTDGKRQKVSGQRARPSHCLQPQPPGGGLGPQLTGGLEPWLKTDVGGSWAPGPGAQHLAEAGGVGGGWEAQGGACPTRPSCSWGAL